MSFSIWIDERGQTARPNRLSRDPAVSSSTLRASCLRQQGDCVTVIAPQVREQEVMAA